MSVYVQGMQMPDRCSHCPLRYVDHSGTAVCKAANSIVILPKDRTRPEYCPLVDLSAEDMRPVVRGEWRKANNPSFSPFDDSGAYIFFCSVCGKSHGHAYRFCPSCGADMRGGHADD